MKPTITTIEGFPALSVRSLAESRTRRIWSIDHSDFVLEFSFPNNSAVILEPISSITSEYNGKIDLYMRGNISKKMSIFRVLFDDGKHAWVLHKSRNIIDRYPLTQSLLESIIIEWIQ